MVEKQEEDEQIIAKVRRYLEEKENLDIQTMYFITKRFNEQLWNEIQDLDEEDVEEDDEDEDFGEFEDVEEDDEDEGLELEEEQQNKIKKKQTRPIIKKPKIKLK